MASDRFSRQINFAPLGAAGQENLAAARVLLVGCGATGGFLAQAMVRAGVGQLVLVDRDVVETSNLPRQVLFSDEDARLGRSKVEAARDCLASIGGPTRLEIHGLHLDAGNLPNLAQGVDLILDGTDNLPTRYLINDHAVQRGLPWVYAGVVGGSGLVLPVLPGRGPCLRCVFPEPPPAGSLPTCQTAGVILPAVGAVASLAGGLALRILACPQQPPSTALLEVDVWEGGLRRIEAAADPTCPACHGRQFPYADAGQDSQPQVLCGRQAVQLPAPQRPPDLDDLGRLLAGRVEELTSVGLFLRFKADSCRLTIFKDGRALVEGTDDPDRARAFYDRWVGA